MKSLSLIFCAGALGLVSCADRPIVVTGSQVGAHVSGSSTTAPNKTIVGYGRSELVHLPKGVAHGGIVGSLDAEFRNFSGAAISETLVTGEAAKHLSDVEVDDEEGVMSTDVASTRGATDVVVDTLSNPHKAVDSLTRPISRNLQRLPDSKTISTNTRFNLGVEAAGSDGAGPSFNFGFRRAVAAIFAPPSGVNDPATKKHTLPSTYADISIHAGGINGNTIDAKGIPRGRHIKQGAIGSRTVQRIATGKAAELLTQQAETRKLVNYQINGRPDSKQ